MKTRIRIYKAMAGCFLAALLLGLGHFQAARGQANDTEIADRIKDKIKISKQRELSNDEPDLKATWWPDGSAFDLQKMEAKDIEKLQIFRLEWPKGRINRNKKEELAEKKYAKRPLTHEEDTQEIEGLLTLLKRAEKYEKPSGEFKPTRPDHVLVVQPVQGEPFEILFSSDLEAPFGEVYSLELKEALYALAGCRTGVTVIHFDNEAVQRTTHHRITAPHAGGRSTQTTDTEMHLTPKNGLTLYVRIREKKEVLMEDEQPLHYGEAKVFKSSGPGHYIVLLHKP